MGGRAGQTLTRSGGGAVSAPPQGNAFNKVNLIQDGNNTTGFTDKTLMALAGVPRDFDGNVKIYHRSGRVSKISLEKDGLSMERVINVREKTVKNEFFEIDENSKYKGTGYKIFESQVNALRKNKFEKIEVAAAGEPGHPRYNGYYTWARFGYQPINKEGLLNRLNTAAGTKFASWYEAMNTETGQKVWKQEGVGFMGEFDLRTGSESMKTWNNYLKYRKSQR